MGRELVWPDEDPRRPHRHVAAQARRQPVGPSLHPHGARRRLPLRQGTGVAVISLRTRLLLALAYVTLLAIVALGAPLALNLRDRVDAEVRSQARSQADVVAATAADSVDHGTQADLARLARTAATNVDGRVLIVDKQGVVLADSAGSGLLGTSYAGRPEIAVALRGVPVQRSRHSNTLG